MKLVGAIFLLLAALSVPIHSAEATYSAALKALYHSCSIRLEPAERISHGSPVDRLYLLVPPLHSMQIPTKTARELIDQTIRIERRDTETFRDINLSLDFSTAVPYFRDD